MKKPTKAELVKWLKARFAIFKQGEYEPDARQEFPETIIKDNGRRAKAFLDAYFATDKTLAQWGREAEYSEWGTDDAETPREKAIYYAECIIMDII